MRVHVAHNEHAKELTAVLEMFGLTQHVTEPTHSRVHTLDVVIFNRVVISNVDVVSVAFSDRVYVFFDLSVTPNPEVVQGRLINDSTGFMEMIRFENTPCSLLNSYTHKSFKCFGYHCSFQG